jgi:hypothetical protein
MIMLSCGKARQAASPAVQATQQQSMATERNAYLSKVSGQNYNGFYGELDFKAISEGVRLIARNF